MPVLHLIFISRVSTRMGRLRSIIRSIANGYFCNVTLDRGLLYDCLIESLRGFGSFDMDEATEASTTVH